MFAEINVEWDSSGKHKAALGQLDLLLSMAPRPPRRPRSPPISAATREAVVTAWEWGKRVTGLTDLKKDKLLSPSYLRTCSEGHPLSLQTSAYQKSKEVEL